MRSGRRGAGRTRENASFSTKGDNGERGIGWEGTRSGVIGRDEKGVGPDPDAFGTTFSSEDPDLSRG